MPSNTLSKLVPNIGQETLATRRQPRGAAIRAQEATRKIIAPIPLKTNRVTAATLEKCVVRTGATTFAMFHQDEETKPPAQWAERYEEYYPAENESELGSESTRLEPNREFNPENEYEINSTEAAEK